MTGIHFLVEAPELLRLTGWLSLQSDAVLSSSGLYTSSSPMSGTCTNQQVLPLSQNDVKFFTRRFITIQLQANFSFPPKNLLIGATGTYSACYMVNILLPFISRHVGDTHRCRYNLCWGPVRITWAKPVMWLFSGLKATGFRSTLDKMGQSPPAPHWCDGVLIGTCSLSNWNVVFTVPKFKLSFSSKSCWDSRFCTMRPQPLPKIPQLWEQ